MTPFHWNKRILKEFSHNYYVYCRLARGDFDNILSPDAKKASEKWRSENQDEVSLARVYLRSVEAEAKSWQNERLKRKVS